VPPPAALSASYVYLLASDHSLSGGQWYVGETDNLPHRWKQHRAARRPAALYAWSVRGKSSARSLESRLIGLLMAGGVPLSNVGDSSHQCFGADDD